MKKIVMLLVFFCAASLFFIGCVTARHQKVADVFRADKLAAMDTAILSAIASNRCPGGVLWLEHDGVAYHKAYGDRALVPDVETNAEDTVLPKLKL